MFYKGVGKYVSFFVKVAQGVDIKKEFVNSALI